jgi:hypothetical protein
VLCCAVTCLVRTAEMVVQCNSSMRKIVLCKAEATRGIDLRAVGVVEGSGSDPVTRTPMTSAMQIANESFIRSSYGMRCDAPIPPCLDECLRG